MKKYLFFLITSACLISQADVISWLRFEENGGNVAFDQTGLLDGELIQFASTDPGGGDNPGEGWSVDVPLALLPLTGQANTGSIRMGGGATYIDLSNFNDIDLGTEFTVEFFMKPDPVMGASVAFGMGDGTAGMNFSLLEDISVNYGVRTDNGTESVSMFSNVEEIQFGVWQHVAIIKQPGLTQFYLDGVLVDEKIYTPDTTPYYISGTGILGDRALGSDDGGTWQGWLDEFRISDEALTPDQFLIMVPEPSSLILLGLGLFCLFRKRK